MIARRTVGVRAPEDLPDAREGLTLLTNEEAAKPAAVDRIGLHALDGQWVLMEYERKREPSSLLVRMSVGIGETRVDLRAKGIGGFTTETTFAIPAGLTAALRFTSGGEKRLLLLRVQ